MLNISGYTILEKIYHSPRTIIYRGLRNQNQKGVVIKIPSRKYPALKDRVHLNYVYELTKDLAISGVIKTYALEQYSGGVALILEDFGHMSLKKFIDIHKLDLKSCLKIMIQLAESLGALHQQHIIHKDIKPHNILIDLHTKQTKITDFGIASRLSQENPQPQVPNALQGTLAYMSPEQTGRMNRILDYRSDFYSLGVTFYQLLTNHLPFQTNDPMKLLHNHLAKQPYPPHQIKSSIPEMVSQITMKLMAKNAEQRYQTTYGLKTDLLRCLEQYQYKKNIVPFQLGLHDISNRFYIPQTLYGREEEVNTLLTMFKKVMKGKPAAMLIAGRPGIGKTALVNEIYKPITQSQGHFVKGKFEQFNRNIPHSALIQALKKLSQQLLTETEGRLAIWKEKFLEAVGANGQIIIDIIPEIELIIGTQLPVPILTPVESQNRFNLVFQNFIRALAKEDHPLVIFLDDLQWADFETLRLLQNLITDPETHYLFLIGAYRDNQVNATHPLMITLEAIQKATIIVNTLTLPPLTNFQVKQIVSETLQVKIEKASPLAMLIFQKTLGNPFFVKQF